MWNTFLGKGYATLFFSNLATKQTLKIHPSQGREPTNKEMDGIVQSIKTGNLHKGLIS